MVCILYIPVLQYSYYLVSYLVPLTGYCCAKRRITKLVHDVLTRIIVDIIPLLL